MFADLDDFDVLQEASEQREPRSCTAWQREYRRCGCPVCVDLPDVAQHHEPAQDPTTWHWPVAATRQHAVLNRIFHWRFMAAFLERHRELRVPYGMFRTMDWPHDDPGPYSLEGTRAEEPPEESFMYRGVILNIRRWGSRLDRFVGVADELIFVHSSDTGDVADVACRKFCAVDLIAVERSPDSNGMLDLEWDWNYYGKVGHVTIVSQDELKRGADAYKFEFYDWPRRRLLSLRKLVDQRRAAPPGFAITKGGDLVRARRTTRESRRPRQARRPQANPDDEDDAPKRLSYIAVLSVLFDRSTVPDDVFRRVVSFHGSLMPERPWLTRAIRDYLVEEDSVEEEEYGDEPERGDGSEPEA